MIKTRISEITHLKKLSPNMAIAMNFIEQTDLSNIEISTNVRIDENIFYNCFTYQSDEEKNNEPEVHKNYIDIHIVLDGEEYIGVSNPIQSIDDNLYDSVNDSAMIALDKPTYCRMEKDDIAIILPYEVHQPKIKINQQTLVKKLVIKVLCDF